MNRIYFMSQVLLLTWQFIFIRAQDCQREGTIDCRSAAKSRYRTLDGSCTHPDLDKEEKARWNKAHTCYNRVLKADYGDFWGEQLRQAKSGQELPNARVLTLLLSTENKSRNEPGRNSNIHSQMLMNFGQILGNEITYPGSVFTYAPGKHYNCCKSEDEMSKPKWPSCAEVPLSKTDPFYTKFGTSCINFSRSQACPLCDVGQRSQINIHTPAIDGSTLYGNSVNDSNNKRSFIGGQLELDEMNYPINAGKNEEGFCGKQWREYYPELEGLKCFRAGDTYVNNNPAKASLVILLYRQHNRIAKMLARVNPSWPDEKLFQETRKIIGAQLEVITYQEFLPEVLGKVAMAGYGLNVLDSGYIGYDANINPSTTAEFTSSAMRAIGHSMINGDMSAVFFNGTKIRYQLKDYIDFLPNFTEPGIVDAYTKGTLVEPIKSVNTKADNAIIGFSQKFAPNKPEYVADLVTIDIMRGRDFGVASYVKFRKLCLDEDIKTFDDLKNKVTKEALQKFKSIYASVEDIDLYYGLLAEYKVIGSIFGPTSICLWGREFYNKKFGDRYYFEQGGQAGSFTPRQLATLRRTSLSKIVCTNGDFYPKQKIQRLAMRLPNRLNNPEVPCDEIADLDIGAWASERILNDQPPKSVKIDLTSFPTIEIIKKLNSQSE